MELSVGNNPVARKQLYRATCIHKIPNLKLLDGKEVTPEERDRAELHFSGDNGIMGSIRAPNVIMASGASGQFSSGPEHSRNAAIMARQGGGRVSLTAVCILLAGNNYF